MFERFRDNFFNFINSRLIVLTLVVLLMGGVLIHRVFVLQIVNGENYLNEFSLKIDPGPYRQRGRKAGPCRLQPETN